MDEKQMDELKQGLMVIQELEERTAGINKRCKKILEIVSDPFKFIMEGEKLENLLDGIKVEFMILGNFADALDKMMNSKEEGE